MDRVARVVGVVMVVAVALWAYRLFDQTVVSDRADAMSASDGPGDQAEGAAPDGVGVSGDGFGEPPRYLAFRPVIPSRVLPVAGDPDSEAPDFEDADDDDADDRATWFLENELGAGLDSSSMVADIEPGLYATSFGVEDCTYEVKRYDRLGRLRSIGQDSLVVGRMLVTLHEIEADVFVPASQCGPWSLWSPLAEPLVVAGPGDYWVGDLTLGRWLVPVGCLWEKVVGFRGARLADVVTSGRGPVELTVDEETLGVRFRTCDRPIELIESSVEPGALPLRALLD